MVDGTGGAGGVGGLGAGTAVATTLGGPGGPVKPECTATSFTSGPGNRAPRCQVGVVLIVLVVMVVRRHVDRRVGHCSHDALWFGANTCGTNACISDRTTYAAKAHKVTPYLQPSPTMARWLCNLVTRPTN